MLLYNSVLVDEMQSSCEKAMKCSFDVLSDGHYLLKIFVQVEFPCQFILFFTYQYFIIDHYALHFTCRAHLGADKVTGRV